MARPPGGPPPTTSTLRRVAVWLSPSGLGVQVTGLALAFIALIVIAALTSSSFLEWSNIKVVLLQSSTIGLVAVPLALLMIAGHIDLSVGSMGALAAVVAGHYWHSDGAAFALVAALVVAVAVCDEDRIDTQLRDITLNNSHRCWHDVSNPQQRKTGGPKGAATHLYGPSNPDYGLKERAKRR